ncbi:hypothetical protein [Spiroplasma citri]|uniref:hypothetical protein n=1 Tax=Spiroplasma citri TaxID=2133 RepID=UPI001EE2726E|nr:hypothetical protein [Spiroplasma citri]
MIINDRNDCFCNNYFSNCNVNVISFLTVNTIFKFKNKYLICPHCSKKVEFKEWGKRKIKKADKSVE